MLIAASLALWAVDAEVSSFSVSRMLASLSRVPLALVVGVVLYAYFHYAKGGDLTAYGKRLFAWDWILLGVRLWICCLLVSFCYFWVKVYIPMFNSRLWDNEVANLDRMVHFGTPLNQASVELLKGLDFSNWIDWWYDLWITTVIWVLAFFLAAEQSVLRRRVMTASLLLWISGVLLYVAFPVLGPVFAFPEDWSEVAGAMPRAEATQKQLAENYQAVLSTRDGNPQEFSHLFGIAALPSLHVAFHFLFSLLSWRYTRVLFVPFLVMTAVTQLGAILSGWHYAIDGYVGMLLAWVCYRVAHWLEKDVEERPSEDFQEKCIS